MKRLINIILMIVFTSTIINAQEMFVTSGSAGKSAKGSLSWVVGGGIVNAQNSVSPVLAPEISKKQKVALSLKDNLNKSSISVFPNPVVEVININTTNNDLIGGQVSITDMAGNHVISQEISDKSLQLQVASLSTGMYVVNTVDKFGKYTESVKIVKK